MSSKKSRGVQKKLYYAKKNRAAKRPTPEQHDDDSRETSTSFSVTPVKARII